MRWRLNTPPGHLVGVGTSATLGEGGEGELLDFAGQIFDETLDDRAVIAESRESVADYLAESVVEYTQNPSVDDLAALDSVAAGSVWLYPLRRDFRRRLCEPEVSA